MSLGMRANCLVANQSGWISIDLQLDLRGNRDTGGQGEKNQAKKIRKKPIGVVNSENVYCK